MTYRARRSPRLAPLDAAKPIENLAERTKTLFLGKDKVGEFLRATLAPLLIYTARTALDIAQSIDDVDRAMRWGFGWELGPFEIWDAIGVREVLEAAGLKGPAYEGAPALVADLLKRGRNSFRDGALPPAAPGLQLLKSAQERSADVKK